MNTAGRDGDRTAARCDPTGPRAASGRIVLRGSNACQTPLASGPNLLRPATLFLPHRIRRPVSTTHPRARDVMSALLAREPAREPGGSIAEFRQWLHVRRLYFDAFEKQQPGHYSYSIADEHARATAIYQSLQPQRSDLSPPPFAIPKTAEEYRAALSDLLNWAHEAGTPADSEVPKLPRKKKEPSAERRKEIIAAARQREGAFAARSNQKSPKAQDHGHAGARSRLDEEDWRINAHF